MWFVATVHVVCWSDTPFKSHVHRLQERPRSLMYSQEVSLLKSSTPDLKPPRCLTHDCTCSEPTVFENYVHDLYVEDQLVELSLWDTAGALLYYRVCLARERCNI